MLALDVPETGLSLCRDNPGNDAAAKPTQIMRLNLAQSTLDELIQSLRNDQTARIRLGKHPTLYYGSKSQHFHSSPEAHRSEVYTGSSADKENLYFTGVLSHTLEVQRAKEATAATDQALANLEQSLNAFERGKESKKTHMITSIDEVKALRAGDLRSSTGRQAAILARKPTTKVEIEKDRLLKTAANRSLSSSPALGSTRSPAPIPPLTPTSAPFSQTKDRARQDALKIPFIHLLAVRAVSAKFLARQTRSSLEDCLALARKYGTENRINPEKFDLRDKTYRELDVWKFPYPSQEDRQEAIENAISAFDRLRISRSDKLWQMLLPKEERGKGKCLSRLNLRTGPIKKALTPKIQVHASDDNGKDGDTTGHETDRASVNGLTPKTALKSGTVAQNKRTSDKEPATKRTNLVNKSKNATNSTLTGRVTKKAERKPTSKPDGKFKSAEFVHDSDDDDTDMLDAPAPEKAKPEQPKQQPKPQAKQPKPTGLKDPSPVPTPKVSKPEALPAKTESTAQTASKSVASKRPPSARAPTQRLPQKPSPPSISPPPAKALDTQSRSRASSQNNSSSSSSSPLIAQLSKPNKVINHSTQQPVGGPKINGAPKAAEPVNPLKRKAELERPPATLSKATGRAATNLEHKRRRAVSTSSGSTGSASPPLSRELLLQQLREKSQKFKQYYAKYRTLHDTMASHPDPPRAELERLQRQHVRLQRMKKEIWDEHRRLRDG
ncbi:uncharacterized protein ACLA_049600 [Aspergillus clavatus NRRL 1]|uniref:Uncharacterized protein n=1 Tax=Aspergillus clavatus (strain ATCC 1007 / CBS 513.65 / DSM 816 / NCTC 3887 / NRRL 1 / QM 1276 / 107) TaxID=344612 RepID=A1CHY3_ASPCL|nr:uncharacterized protein ACLA_049600 [Aspergillus clavatus NRRL 1]EAW10488.1 conserved hypothetical protein [Aspergillus clavatus NRRL 1]